METLKRRPENSAILSLSLRTDGRIAVQVSLYLILVQQDIKEIRRRGSQRRYASN